MINQIFKEKDIFLNQQAKDKYEAIRLAGKYLVENGYVSPEYVEKMLEREEMITTYIGNHIAIPHGTEDAAQFILNSGVVLLQMNPPVAFDDGEKAKLVIGIAGKDGQHMDILSNIAIFCSEVENVETLYAGSSPVEILQILGGK